MFKSSRIKMFEEQVGGKGKGRGCLGKRFAFVMSV